jgi:hypothetical protein
MALPNPHGKHPLEMRVLVCGGRDFNDPSFVFRHLYHQHDQSPITLLISGGASGVDRFANSWAEGRHIATLEIRAQWKKHGRAAGPLRNAEMLRLGKPDLVMAFPGGKGTANMVEQATQHGVTVVEISLK